MMGCQVIINSWTLPSLVGAFLDLFIAYCLLCCSAFAYFLSKFLAIFGFTLPCSCTGLFGHAPCLQRLLVDYPPDAISSVQLSVKTNFPFHTLSDRCHLNLKLVRDRISDDGVLELEGEASYTSLSGHQTDSRKAKGPATQRLRRHRRASVDYLRPESLAIRRSPSDLSEIGAVDDSTIVNFHGRSVLDNESNETTDESKFMRKSSTSFQDLKDALGTGHVTNGVGGNADKILELALEEEQVTRAALCSELEQERLAAATAADEAMAMISRLQEEKASIAIEARQFQRILEEKSAYDAEEMEILKEIIVRREREKHFLEKEVEAYRKMFKASSESQSNDTQEQNDNSFLDLDPMIILQQLSESIDKRRNVENLGNYPDFTSLDVHSRTCTVSETKELTISSLDHKTRIIDELESPCPIIIPDNLKSDDDAYQDFQEKEVLSLNEVSYPHLCETSSSEGHNNSSLQQSPVCDAGKSDYGEPHVHDVHIIGPSYASRKIKDVAEGDQIYNSTNLIGKSELPVWASYCQKDDGSTDNGLINELGINRSSSDIVKHFPTVTSSHDRSFTSEMRHNSLSAVDSERLRIDSEIGWLRERLRAVQEEKERLKSSMENREFQLLKDVAGQHQEICHAAPELDACQTYLPPLSSKGMSKKRQSRSASIGVGRSDSS